MQPVRAGLPARGDPRQGLRRERAGRARRRRSSRRAYKGNEFTRASSYTIQVAPEDCTGCNLCVNVCPAKDRTNPKHKAIDMQPQAPLRDAERANYDFFLDLPESTAPPISPARPQELAVPRAAVRVLGRVRRLRRDALPQAAHAAVRRPLLIANATGCSSIYGGNLPTTPYTTNRDGPRPGLVELAVRGQRRVRLGFRLALDATSRARGLVSASRRRSATAWHGALLDADQSNEAGHRGAARARRRAASRGSLIRRPPRRAGSKALADYLVKKSVWLVGGDGWAYDIGYGGLDHVLANRRDVNVLVLDTEVYSNTGGQQSKATPLGAAAKFAAAGKPVGKKDLGLLANMYGHVYVARVAFGAKMAQTAQALLEAEAYPGRRSSSPTATASRTATTWRRARAAEAGGRLGRLAALPLRSAAARQGRAAAAPRLRPAKGAGRRLHAQRVALPHGRARRSRALTSSSSRSRRRRPSGATPSTSSSRASPCR